MHSISIFICKLYSDSILYYLPLSCSFDPFSWAKVSSFVSLSLLRFLLKLPFVASTEDVRCTGIPCPAIGINEDGSSWEIPAEEFPGKSLQTILTFHWIPFFKFMLFAFKEHECIFYNWNTKLLPKTQIIEEKLERLLVSSLSDFACKSLGTKVFCFNIAGNLFVVYWQNC